MSFDKFDPLASEFDDNVVWEFLNENGVTKENFKDHLTPRTGSGCNIADCKNCYDGAVSLYYGLDEVGYDPKANKFVSIENITEEELNEKGIRILDYFQIYLCPECGNLEHYIE